MMIKPGVELLSESRRWAAGREANYYKVKLRMWVPGEPVRWLKPVVEIAVLSERSNVNG